MSVTNEQLTAAGRAWVAGVADGNLTKALEGMREALQPALQEQWNAGYKHAAWQSQNCAPTAPKPQPQR